MSDAPDKTEVPEIPEQPDENEEEGPSVEEQAIDPGSSEGVPVKDR